MTLPAGIDQGYSSRSGVRVGAPLITIYLNIISNLIFYCKISPPFFFQYDIMFASRTRVTTSDSPLVYEDIGWVTDDGRLLWAISIIQMCI